MKVLRCRITITDEKIRSASILQSGYAKNTIKSIGSIDQTVHMSSYYIVCHCNDTGNGVRWMLMYQYEI